MTKRTRMLLVLVGLLAVLAAACGSSEPPGSGEGSEAPSSGDATASESEGGGEAAVDLELVEEGKLTVCTDAPYKPMEFEENGEYTGFDIELLRAVGEQLGLELSVINSGFDPIVSGAALKAGQCDIAAASITITDERKEAVEFTDPYFEAEQSLLVKKDGDVQALADLAGKRIGVQSETTGETYANENKPDGADVVSFENPGDIFVALEAGDIQAVLQDLVVNQGRALEDDSVEVVEKYQTDEQYGFAAEKGNTQLTDAVNDVLTTFNEDGTYDEIYGEWFGEG